MKTVHDSPDDTQAGSRHCHQNSPADHCRPSPEHVLTRERRGCALYLRDALLLVITAEEELWTGPRLVTDLLLVTTVTTVSQTVTYLVLEIETRTGIWDQTTDLLSQETGPRLETDLLLVTTVTTVTQTVTYLVLETETRTGIQGPDMA